jgi:cytochrome b561
MSGSEPRHHAAARYGGVAQAFHWVTAILVLLAFIYGPGGSEERVYSAARDFDRRLHETLGLTVMMIVALRLLWRTVDTQPDAEMSPWMRILASVTHGALYLLLFAVPLAAIAGAWLEGHPLTLLAGIEVPPGLPLAHDTGTIVARIHKWLGDAIMWLAGLHAVAALFHQLVLGDGVLASMLPRWIPLRNPDRGYDESTADSCRQASTWRPR